MKKQPIVLLSLLNVFALSSCGVASYTHTSHMFQNVYHADINHDGQFNDYPDPFDDTHIFHEKGKLNWADSFDTLIQEANSTSELTEIADAMGIAADEPERTSLARYEVLHEANELTMQTSALVPIYNYRDPFLLKPNHTGIYCSDLGAKFFDQLQKGTATGDSFNVSVGTKAETLDPAENSDSSTSMIMANCVVGAKAWTKGDEYEDYKGIFEAKIEDGIAKCQKKMLVAKGDVKDPNTQVDITTLKDIKESEYPQYLNTARWYINIKPEAYWNRNGVKGDRITTDDFFWAWRRTASSEFGMWCSMMDSIKGYKEWNDYTGKNVGKINYDDPDNLFSGLVKTDNPYIFEVQLVNDCSYFEELLAFPAFEPVDRKVVEKAGKSWWLNPNTYSCNGPFRFTKIDNKETGVMELTKNEFYYKGEKTVIPKKVTFSLLDEDSAMLSRYKSNTLCMIDSIAAGMIDQVKHDMPDQWKVANQVGMYYLIFNVNDNSFDIMPNESERIREKFRRILTLLINRSDICRSIVKSGATPANDFVSEGIMEQCYPVWNAKALNANGNEGAWVAKRDGATEDKPFEGTLVPKAWHDRNTDRLQEAIKQGGYNPNPTGTYDPKTTLWLGARDEREDADQGFYPVAENFESRDEEKEIMEKVVDEALEIANDPELKLNYDKRTGKFTNFPHVSIVTNTGTGHESICERMQDYLLLFGINMDIKTEEWNAFLASKREGDFAFARNGWIADFSDARTYLDISTTEHGNNDTQFGRDNHHKSR